MDENDVFLKMYGQKCRRDKTFNTTPFSLSVGMIFDKFE